jgi:hypothetical protein
MLHKEYLRPEILNGISMAIHKKTGGLFRHRHFFVRKIISPEGTKFGEPDPIQAEPKIPEFLTIPAGNAGGKNQAAKAAKFRSRKKS